MRRRPGQVSRFSGVGQAVKQTHRPQPLRIAGHLDDGQQGALGQQLLDAAVHLAHQAGGQQVLEGGVVPGGAPHVGGQHQLAVQGGHLGAPVDEGLPPQAQNVFAEQSACASAAKVGTAETREGREWNSQDDQPKQVLNRLIGSEILSEVRISWL